MKKIMFICACLAILASCDQQRSNNDERNMVEDSLQNIIDQKDHDLNDLMGMLSEVQEGFAQINEAQGRVNTLNQNVEEGNARTNIQENMQFIQQTIAQNRIKIDELQEKLKQSGINSSKLKTMIDNLSAQLTSKTKEIVQLRAQLAEKDVVIEELDQSLSQLQEEHARVSAENENNAQIAKNQDQQLNTAWYVYGTTKELKQHKILADGDVLQQGDFDKEYFTKIDIRTTSVINLGSKSAKILTNHPDGSYTLLKDSKGDYTLRITDAYKFWSISKYLVIRVK